MAEREGGLVNDSFVFYQSFLNAIKCLPKENQLYAYQYITEYALQWIEPNQDEDTIAYAIFLMAKPQIDANSDRRKNWNKWGRPQKEKPMVSENTENEKPLVIENEQNEKPNVNVNVNVNVKENVKRKFLDYVYLSDEEYKKISERYWEVVLKDFIERLDNRIWEKPNSKDRKDRNHYRTILQWIKKEWIKEKSPPPKEEPKIKNLRDNDIYLQSLSKWMK